MDLIEQLFVHIAEGNTAQPSNKLPIPYLQHGAEDDELT